MNSSKKVVSCILLALSLISNLAHAKFLDGINDSDDLFDMYDDQDDCSSEVFQIQNRTSFVNFQNTIYLLAGVFFLGSMSYFLMPENAEMSDNTEKKTINNSSNDETQKKCLAEMNLKNGIRFSVFYGDILDWQGDQKEKGKKYIVCSPDNSNLHPNGGLANKICQKIGGHFETNKGNKDYDNWVYPDQLALRAKLSNENPDKSEDLKVGKGILGQGSADFDVWHLVGESVNCSGTKLSDTQKTNLKKVYIDAMADPHGVKEDTGNECLYSSINLCTVSDSLFNVTSQESAEALAEALLEIDSKRIPPGLKNINLVIHSCYDSVNNDDDKGLKRSNVFINTIQKKFGNDINGQKRLKIFS